MNKQILSGIKPSGDLNIGGYGGALSQFVQYQHDFECFFFVPDLHAITVPQDPQQLARRTREIAAFYIAAGIDPTKSAIFLQSQVPAHTELAWLLETQASFGELGRMTQFKDKSNGKESVSSALFTYPVLMAADILLYQATHVPVGEDQKQHLELTRNLAERFNHRFGETFVVPEPLIQDIGSRIMGLDDPTKKMSKSNPNLSSYVLMLDPPDTIRKKFARAVTDSESSVRCDWDTKPAVSNLIEIYSVFANEPVEIIEKRYAGEGYGTFKKDLAEVVVDKLVPIQEKFKEIVDSRELDDILKRGAQKASEKAYDTLKRAKQAMGLVTF
ncbi:tryptophan--tRNA ligase [Paenibacillus sp. JJ-223]|uniref:tryptophan--tRNA ligase n=1 Tax=Paenibacillus sp. JJ-223 TaxID=2905647 RepID=UPI001F01B0AC|nr:tryptophan--tRNA ligase [Paenibacillus sp. JJ-223]CAH1199134.1 Tryptophan--tRNA ligase [Paenibacillus sp. JJ-223]